MDGGKHGRCSTTANKVQAVINGSSGSDDHSGTEAAGWHAARSSAENSRTSRPQEKLPNLRAARGGYLATGRTRGPCYRVRRLHRHKVGLDGSGDKGRGVSPPHRESPVRQARPVAADAGGTDADPGRPDSGGRSTAEGPRRIRGPAAILVASRSHDGTACHMAEQTDRSPGRRASPRAHDRPRGVGTTQRYPKQVHEIRHLSHGRGRRRPQR